MAYQVQTETQKNNLAKSTSSAQSKSSTSSLLSAGTTTVNGVSTTTYSTVSNKYNTTVLNNGQSPISAETISTSTGSKTLLSYSDGSSKSVSTTSLNQATSDLYNKTKIPDTTTTNIALGNAFSNTVTLGDTTVDLGSNADLSIASSLSSSAALKVGEGLSTVSSAAAAALAAAQLSAAFDLSAKYQQGNSRLVDFTYTTGSDDDQRRAYMKLKGQVSDFIATIQGSDQSLVYAVYQHLISKYTSFVLLRLDENMQEKQNIMPTVGDSFAATFAGAEPQVLSISGYLPFDGDAETSWFKSFIRAYKKFIRASKLAQYRCQLELVLPDYETYTCYPINITAGLSSEQDNLIPFSMNLVVVDKPSPTGYGYTSTTTADKTTAEEVATAESTETKNSEIETQTTKDPKDVGEASQKKTFVQNVQDAVKSAGTALKEVNKGLTVLNQVKGAVSVLQGNAYGQRYINGKVGRGTWS